MFYTLILGSKYATTTAYKETENLSKVALDKFASWFEKKEYEWLGLAYSQV